LLKTNIFGSVSKMKVSFFLTKLKLKLNTDLKIKQKITQKEGIQIKRAFSIHSRS
jgi:hypothetical protein